MVPVVMEAVPLVAALTVPLFRPWWCVIECCRRRQQTIKAAAPAGAANGDGGSCCGGCVGTRPLMQQGLSEKTRNRNKRPPCSSRPAPPARGAERDTCATRPRSSLIELIITLLILLLMLLLKIKNEPRAQK